MKPLAIKNFITLYDRCAHTILNRKRVQTFGHAHLFKSQ